VPVGSVISWSVPADPSLGAGGDVLPDTEVALVVSVGPAPRTIPPLAGLTVADASAQHQALQLVPSVAEAVFSDTVPIDSVVSVAPDAGAQVERGSTVVLTPSKGVDLVTMPDLTGQFLDQARTTLANAGLTVGSLLGSSTGVFVQATVGGDPADVGEQFKRGTAIDMVFF
jgi:serine/threonine-protein kinase